MRSKYEQSVANFGLVEIVKRFCSGSSGGIAIGLVGVQDYRNSILFATAGASPDGIALCIITDCVKLRSECTRLLACAETTTQKLGDNY